MTTTGQDYENPKLKLSIFPSSFSSEEILFHPDDLPHIQPGHVVEIYNEESFLKGRNPRLLLKIKPGSLNSKSPISRNTVYIEKSIAETFKLPNFKNVVVRKVCVSKISLDMVELTFRDQYMNRSEMWKIKSELLESCVFINKKLDFFNGSIRCQVNEMWAEGLSLACGIVSIETKIVFRSPTAMIYLFIQMSSEMWEMDPTGHLYFEKAVGGFLSELFDRWKRASSSHEMTIVLFSRFIYEIECEAQFSENLRDSIQKDYNGNFYEDFYSVIFQNERFDDGSTAVLKLKKYFTDYKTSILCQRLNNFKEKKIKLKNARISSAEQGNFLEVLNISLNTFQNHFLDKNMDRTGQQCVVLTAGVGVFDVNTEMLSLTKQRIIESGSGIDLICVGEQPLHAVPLLKLNHVSSDLNSGKVEYSMPHWINLSFYSLNTKLGSTIFRPRIKLPGHLYSTNKNLNLMPVVKSLDTTRIVKKKILNTKQDIFDLYDDSIFNNKRLFKEYQVSFDKNIKEIKTSPCKNMSYLDQNNQITVEKCHKFSMFKKKSSKKIYQNDTIEKLEKAFVESLDFNHQVIKRLLLFPGRALINPFFPSHTMVRISSNRRRWAHIFPSLKHQDINLPSSSTENSRCFTIHRWSGGVDWKSLIIPALFPITTDYIPNKASLNEDYLFTEYSFRPDDIQNDLNIRSAVSLSPTQLFRELISQRLVRGFQLIIRPSFSSKKKTRFNVDYNCIEGKRQIEIWLSIGKCYHKICLDYNQVTVKILRPRKKQTADFSIEYKYKFQSPDNNLYEDSFVRFCSEKLEAYNWNHIDYYVHTKGDREFPLTESLKYWRLRLLLIPLTAFLSTTKKVLDQRTRYCDIYNDICTETIDNLEGFFRFLDSSVNKIKRKNNNDSHKSNNFSMLTNQSSFEDILKRMKSAEFGIKFLVKSASFPEDSFLSYDAVLWYMSNSNIGKIEAIKKFQTMISKGFLRHCSGDPKYIYTRYLFFPNSHSPWFKVFRFYKKYNFVKSKLTWPI